MWGGLDGSQRWREAHISLRGRLWDVLEEHRAGASCVTLVHTRFVFQATSGGGGWPMSVWLTPDLKPFAGGTYFPPEDGVHRVGFRTVLLRIAEQVRGRNGVAGRAKPRGAQGIGLGLTGD